ncbi:PAS domain S-box protein [Mucilaginibacter panaciglaebae]|uniref:histidine kinase n=1 Tax=Mucilaginibacter panaciglaebae TaxID=502331 RepID=A0ABP7X118_9SPHI
MKFQDSSIQNKIMSAILFTCTVVLLLMSIAYFLFEYFSYKRTIKDNLSTLGAIIASNSSAALAFDSQSDAREILGALKGNPHIVAACLYDDQGRLFATYPTVISALQLPAKPQPDGYRFSNGVLEGYEPVTQRSDRLGTLYIKSDLGQMYTQLGNLLFTAGLLFTIVLLIAFLLSVLLKRRIAKPILLLEDTARSISQGHDYSLRAARASEEELSSLTDAFNQMLTQIELQNQALLDAGAENRKLAAVVESSNDPIISMTREGIIISWNDAAQRTFGYTADELIGQSIMKIVPPERQQEEIELLTRLENGEGIEQFETQRITKNKKILEVSLTISPVKDAQGRIIGSSKIARDISEKKQEERRKNDFIGMVSHELKTPLTSIRSYVQILLAEAKKRSSDAFIINALTRADVQTRKMSHMIQDFLNLARLEEGKIQLQQNIFELQPLIEEIASDAQALTTAHHIQFNNCTGVKVKADREKIGQVLMNLLTNAIKYSPKGGDITITGTPQTDKITIRVADHGVGIGATEQKKLFQRFYRVENEQIQVVSGFGIGLYLVSEMLRYHNSQIEVESQEGVGSSFIFSLNMLN